MITVWDGGVWAPADPAPIKGKAGEAKVHFDGTGVKDARWLRRQCQAVVDTRAGG
jgi:hypothetical protein